MPPSKKRAKKPPNQADIIKTIQIMNNEEKKTTVQTIEEYLCKKVTNAKFVKQNPNLIKDLIEDAVAESKIFKVKNMNSDDFEYRTPKTIGEDRSLIVFYSGNIPGPTYFHLLKAGQSIEFDYGRKTSNNRSDGITSVEWLEFLNNNARFLNYNLETFKEKLISLAIKRGHLVKVKSSFDEDKIDEDQIRFTITDKFREDYKLFRRNRKMALQAIGERDTNGNDNYDDTNDIKLEENDDENSNLSFSGTNDTNEDTAINNKAESDESNLTSNSNKNVNPEASTTAGDEENSQTDAKINRNQSEKESPATPSASKGRNTDQSSLQQSNTITPNQPQRVSQRKKIKKTLGPDFLDSSIDMNVLMSHQKQNYLKVSHNNTSSSSSSQQSEIPSSKSQATICLICKGPYRYLQKFQNPIVCCQCESKAHGTCFKTFVGHSPNIQWICTNCCADSVCFMCRTVDRKPDFYIMCKSCSTCYHPHCWREKAHALCQKCRIQITNVKMVNDSGIYSSDSIASSNRLRAAPKVTTIATINNKLVFRSNSLLQANVVGLSTSNSGGGKSLINKDKAKVIINCGTQFANKPNHETTNSPDYSSSNNEIAVKEEPADDSIEVKSSSPSNENITSTTVTNSKSIELTAKSPTSQPQHQKIESRKRKHHELSSFDIWHKKPNQSICYNFQTWLESELKYNCKRFGPEVDLTPLSSLPNVITEWTAENVHRFISTLGFKEEAEIFLEKDIDGLTIMLLTRHDFLHALSIKTGPAIRLLGIVNRLHEEI